MYATAFVSSADHKFKKWILNSKVHEKMKHYVSYEIYRDVKPCYSWLPQKLRFIRIIYLLYIVIWNKNICNTTVFFNGFRNAGMLHSLWENIIIKKKIFLLKISDNFCFGIMCLMGRIKMIEFQNLAFYILEDSCSEKWNIWTF